MHRFLNSRRAALGVIALSQLCTARVAVASELEVRTTHIAARGASVTADVRWKNAWRTARNHDAVWLFVKYRATAQSPWQHAKVRNVSAASTNPRISCRTSNDRVGAFCSAASIYRGDISTTATIDIDTTSMSSSDRSAPGFEVVVLGLEVVYIADGPFTIGDKDTASLAQAAFYRSDASGNYAGTMRITSENAIVVGPRAGALYYRSVNQYQGDRLGPIPERFPKGTRAFYAMKYEPTQGEYATFLNMIGRDAASARANLGERNYRENRGTMSLVDGRYVAASPRRPNNMMSWDDGIAFADWSGLRPMTEFEFTKAARGPADPLASDYPWGTNSKTGMQRRMTAAGELTLSSAADEAKLTDATREMFGASYWWVMDLAGSVWEKVVTIGHPKGRAFTGTHGDGELHVNGRATNSDWPAGDDEGGGYGYRGGGFYEWTREQTRDTPERTLNPYSPVSWRPYGSWGGAPRGVAYGFRAVRSADGAR